jgi:hypothetical protein
VLSRGPFRGRDYAILLMTVFMSSAEKARSVSVRMLPCPPMRNASAVAAISSAASLIVTYVVTALRARIKAWPSGPRPWFREKAILRPRKPQDSRSLFRLPP